MSFSKVPFDRSVCQDTPEITLQTVHKLLSAQRAFVLSAKETLAEAFQCSNAEVPLAPVSPLERRALFATWIASPRMEWDQDRPNTKQISDFMGKRRAFISPQQDQKTAVQAIKQLKQVIDFLARALSSGLCDLHRQLTRKGGIAELFGNKCSVRRLGEIPQISEADRKAAESFFNEAQTLQTWSDMLDEAVVQMKLAETLAEMHRKDYDSTYGRLLKFVGF